MNDLSSGSAAGSSLDFDTPLEESASQPMGMGRYWKAPALWSWWFQCDSWILWYSMIFYDVLWCSMMFYDVLWCSMCMLCVYRRWTLCHICFLFWRFVLCGAEDCPLCEKLRCGHRRLGTALGRRAPGMEFTVFPSCLNWNKYDNPLHFT